MALLIVESYTHHKETVGGDINICTQSRGLTESF